MDIYELRRIRTLKYFGGHADHIIKIKLSIVDLYSNPNRLYMWLFECVSSGAG